MILKQLDPSPSRATGLIVKYTFFFSRRHYFRFKNRNGYTPNANMADHSVGARDEYESEAREASVLCFDNTSPEKSCFVDGLVCFISLCLLVLCS